MSRLSNQICSDFYLSKNTPHSTLCGLKFCSDVRNVITRILEGFAKKKQKQKNNNNASAHVIIVNCVTLPPVLLLSAWHMLSCECAKMCTNNFCIESQAYASMLVHNYSFLTHGSSVSGRINFDKETLLLSFPHISTCNLYQMHLKVEKLCKRKVFSDILRNLCTVIYDNR